jgi:UDP-N-acetylglucosamine:LPS N-acetylglucosamine transferase
VNASYLVRHGAAEVLDDTQLKDQLLEKVLELMQDHAKREQMSQAMKSLARPEASARIAAMLNELGRPSPRKANDHDRDQAT